MFAKELILMPVRVAMFWVDVETGDASVFIRGFERISHYDADFGNTNVSGEIDVLT